MDCNAAGALDVDRLDHEDWAGWPCDAVDTARRVLAVVDTRGVASRDSVARSASIAPADDCCTAACLIEVVVVAAAEAAAAAAALEEGGIMNRRRHSLRACSLSP